MYGYAVAKHITNSIYRYCLYNYSLIQPLYIYAKVAMAFIDTVDIYACALHNAKVACYKHTAGFVFV